MPGQGYQGTTGEYVPPKRSERRRAIRTVPGTEIPTCPWVPTRRGTDRCRVHGPEGAGGTYVHFHGGAFVMRHPKMDDFFCRLLVVGVSARSCTSTPEVLCRSGRSGELAPWEAMSNAWSGPSFRAERGRSLSATSLFLHGRTKHSGSTRGALSGLEMNVLGRFRKIDDPRFSERAGVLPQDHGRTDRLSREPSARLRG